MEVVCREAASYARRRERRRQLAENQRDESHRSRHPVPLIGSHTQQSDRTAVVHERCVALPTNAAPRSQPTDSVGCHKCGVVQRRAISPTTDDAALLRSAVGTLHAAASVRAAARVAEARSSQADRERQTAGASSCHVSNAGAGKAASITALRRNVPQCVLSIAAICAVARLLATLCIAYVD